MATKYKIKTLTGDDKKLLDDILSKMTPDYKESFLNALENNDLYRENFDIRTFLPKEYAPVDENGMYLKDNPTVDKLKDLAKRLPDIKTAYNKYIESTKNEADLTDEELQGRLEAFQGLGTQKELTGYDEDNLLIKAKEIAYKKATDSGFSLTENVKRTLDAGAKKAVDILLNRDTLKNSDHFSTTDPVNQLKSKLGDYAQYKDIDTGDIKRIQDALSTRQATAEKESAINQYVEGIPEELRQGREEFMSGEEDRAYRELERQVPLTLQNLNVRGMLYSGEREDALSSKALNLSSSLEQIQADLEEEDNQFYYDSAYRNALRKDLKASSDYESSIAENRSTVMKEREQRYKSYQTTLNQQLEEEMTKSNYSRQLASYRRKLEQAQKDKDESAQSSLLTGIASSAAGIATGYGLSKIG